MLRRKHLALLIYLALSPNRRRTRVHLVGVLWPEIGEAQARHSPNEAIRRLRAHLGAARVESDGDSVSIRALAVLFEPTACSQRNMIAPEPRKGTFSSWVPQRLFSFNNSEFGDTP